MSLSFGLLGSLSTAPKGEQCVIKKGASLKGPDVCRLSISIAIALVTAVALVLADLR